MSILVKLHPDILSREIVSVLSAQSLCGLASTSRYFRELLSQERVWALLNERDHRFIAPGQQLSSIRDQLNRVAAIAEEMKTGQPTARASKYAKEAFERLVAVQSLLFEM